jgi:hypothetical protein
LRLGWRSGFLIAVAVQTFVVSNHMGASMKAILPRRLVSDANAITNGTTSIGSIYHLQHLPVDTTPLPWW